MIDGAEEIGTIKLQGKEAFRTILSTQSLLIMTTMEYIDTISSKPHMYNLCIIKTMF